MIASKSVSGLSNTSACAPKEGLDEWLLALRASKQRQQLHALVCWEIDSVEQVLFALECRQPWIIIELFFDTGLVGVIDA